VVSIKNKEQQVMKTFFFIVFLFFCSAIELSGQVPSQNNPQNPTEAYERAKKPLNDWFKSKEPTLEGNIKANKETERLAREYANLFKIKDCKGKELYSLAQLYELAMQFADVEKALTEYLRAPADDKLIKARTTLLLALINQKKISAAIPVAEQLLNEPKYNQDIISFVQLLIDELRPIDIKSAIAIAEKRHLKLINYAEDNIGNPGKAASAYVYALDLSSMYQETGDTAKSQAFVASFLSQFNSSPAASDERIKKSVDAVLLRHKLIGTKAPSIEAFEYIDMPKTSIADLSGKVILLDFLAHWCAPCIESFPETNALKQKYESKGLVIVGVTSYFGYFGEREKLAIPDELAELKKLKSQRNANFGFIVGPLTNLRAYGMVGLPAVVLIDRQGKIRYIKQGADYKKEIEKIIQTLVGENITN
jgi:thiol-disulfide isomerase/thioredoxin